MHVQYRALLLTRTASVGYYDGTGRNVILKLHIAAAGDKEIQLFLDIIQLALGAVAVRYSALLQQLSRQALCVAAEHLIGSALRRRMLISCRQSSSIGLNAPHSPLRIMVMAVSWVYAFL